MNAKQRRETDRNIRAKDFLADNVGDFSTNQIAKTKIAALSSLCADVENEYQRQMSGAVNVRQDYVMMDEAFAVLLEAMRRVRDFANSMAKEIAGLDKKFRIPTSRTNRAIIAAARVNAGDAVQYEETFIAYGLPAGFIDDLFAKADAAEAALNAAEATTGSKVGATDTLAQYVKEANTTVETLDPIVRYTFRENPTKLAAWNYAAHVQRHTPVPFAARRRKPKPAPVAVEISLPPPTVLNETNLEM